jgi:hypothetical protein
MRPIKGITRQRHAQCGHSSPSISPGDSFVLCYADTWQRSGLQLCSCLAMEISYDHPVSPTSIKERTAGPLHIHPLKYQGPALNAHFPSQPHLPYLSSSLVKDDDNYNNVFSRNWTAGIIQSRGVHALYRKQQQPTVEPYISKRPV